MLFLNDTKLSKESIQKFIIVPDSYVDTVMSANGKPQCLVQYPAPPFDKDSLDTIKSFIESRAVPPESWESYKCVSKGVFSK